MRAEDSLFPGYNKVHQNTSLFKGYIRLHFDKARQIGLHKKDNHKIVL